MIDTPFQLLDINSEETGLVCGIDGCSIEPSTQPLETTSHPVEQSKQAVMRREEWKKQGKKSGEIYQRKRSKCLKTYYPKL